MWQMPFSSVCAAAVPLFCCQTMNLSGGLWLGRDWKAAICLLKVMGETGEYPWKEKSHSFCQICCSLFKLWLKQLSQLMV